MKLKLLLRNIAIIGLVLLILGPILFFVEGIFCLEESGLNAVKIAVIGVVFFAYTLLSLFVHQHLLLGRSNLLISYYLLDKILRLFVAIALLIAYKFYVEKGLVLFAINLFVYYLTTALLTTIYSIKTEKLEYQR